MFSNLILSPLLALLPIVALNYNLALSMIASEQRCFLCHYDGRNLTLGLQLLREKLLRTGILKHKADFIGVPHRQTLQRNMLPC